MINNIAEIFINKALTIPDKTAIIWPKKKFFRKTFHYENISFGQLHQLVEFYAQGLLSTGLKKGDRCLVFLRPGVDFPAVTFALFLTGIVPVFIDPGMGKKNLLAAIARVKPKGLIALAQVHILKYFYPTIFQSIKVSISNARFPLGAKYSLSQFRRSANNKSNINNSIPKTLPRELAAILFTSGGTGIPKGVEYTHKIFIEQTRLLQTMFKLTDEDRDFPAFPLFCLFTLSMGMTSSLPYLDPSRPAKCDPQLLLQNILDTKPTFIAGSPAIWQRLADYAKSTPYTLASVKTLAMFGAPVRVELHQQLLPLIPNGDTKTPYGATECLPVCLIGGREILAQTAALTLSGEGTCIGLPVEGMQVKIIEISDTIIKYTDQIVNCKAYQVGEIITQGICATQSYFEMDQQTQLAKIYDRNQQTFWHRMGDIGYSDDAGRIWFCGRKSHRVELKQQKFYPNNCETVFNLHPDVNKSALVSIEINNIKKAAIILERHDHKEKSNISAQQLYAFKQQIEAIANKYPHTQKINVIGLASTLPVDVRHNIKIDRLQVAKNIIKDHERNIL